MQSGFRDTQYTGFTEIPGFFFFFQYLSNFASEGERQGFSFLCTFVPGSEKTIERTFVPWNIRSLELSFLGSEGSKNFRSVEHSLP